MKAKAIKGEGEGEGEGEEQGAEQGEGEGSCLSGNPGTLFSS